jgi:hypothetical protein
MSDKIKQSKCACNCFEEKAVDPSRRDFIRKASTLTLIGSTAFILEACGGGSSPTGPDDNNGDTGGGDNTVEVEIMAVEIMAAEQEILAIIMIHQLVLLLLISL